MEKIRTAIALLCFAFFMVGAKPWGARGQVANYFKSIGAPLDFSYIREVADLTDFYARRVCLQGELNTLLANWICESSLNMFEDDGVSHGVAQVKKSDRKFYRNFWKLRGVDLPLDDEALETQIALGVAAFSIKLRDAKGDVWDAVRRYNGAGPGARRHRDKVRAMRLEVFGQPWKAGEFRDYTECGRKKP